MIGILATAETSFAAPPASGEKRELVTSLADLSLEKRDDVSYRSSPDTWADQSVYFLMVDRFNRSKSPTYAINKDTQPTDPKGWHGGDIKGIHEKLRYLKGSGVSTVWMTPVLDNDGTKDQYHGYGIVRFGNVDMRFGSEKDLTDFVKAAHDEGLYVMFDIVVNHTNRAFEYAGKDEFSPTKLPIGKRNTQVLPKELHGLENFSQRGTVTNWNEPEQVTNGDFVDGGFRHFDLSRPETQDHFIKLSKYYVARFGIDAIRMDTVKHVAPEFWPRWNHEVKKFAAGLGKKNFGTFAEFFAATPADMARLTSPVEGHFEAIDPKGTNMGFTGPLNFVSLFDESPAAMGKGPTTKIKTSHEVLSKHLTQSQLLRSARFVDNHDVPRALGPNEGQISNLKTAMARTWFGSGIPINYYGTEQGFRQMHGEIDPNNPGLLGRPDMFDSPFKSPGAPRGSSFNTNHPLYVMQRQYSDVRNTYPALRRGAEYERASDPNGAGLYVFSRIHEGKEVVVVINTSGQAKTANNFYVDKEIWGKHVGANATAKAKLVDTLHPEYTTHVGGIHQDGHYTAAQVGAVEVPAHGVRVLVPEADYKPTPVQNFDPSGNAKPWRASTLRAAARLKNAPSVDGARAGFLTPKAAPQAPANRAAPMPVRKPIAPPAVPLPALRPRQR